MLKLITFLAAYKFKYNRNETTIEQVYIYNRYLKFSTFSKMSEVIPKKLFRTPSRLYHIQEKDKTSNDLALVGPEFIVWSRLSPSKIHVIGKNKMKNVSNKYTVQSGLKL